MYIKKKCNSCGYWAVFEFSIFCRRASETCTRCHYSLKNIAWDREARHHFDESTKLFEELCEKYPKLRELKQPGDHLKIEDQN